MLSSIYVHSFVKRSEHIWHVLKLTCECIHFHVVVSYDNAVGRFETDVISVRLGRSVSREELLTEHSAMSEATKSSATTAAAQWKFLCIEGHIH